MTDPLTALTALICEHSGLTGARAERLAERIAAEWLPVVADADAPEWHIKRLAAQIGAEVGSSVDGPTLRRAAEALLLHYGYATPERVAAVEMVRRHVAQERDALIDGMLRLCNDEWLKRRDRFMGLADLMPRGRASSAIEHAARDIRLLLNRAGVDTSDHADYLAWMRAGRPAARAAVDGGEHD